MKHIKSKLQDAQNASAAELAKLRQERDQAKAIDETYKKKLAGRAKCECCRTS